MIPTPEQSAIIHNARRTSDNLLINALAGAAKTTTLEMICQKITGIPILSLAFNRRIADEMKKRLPSHVNARTMNSLGHEVWGRATGKKLVVDPQKMYTILRGVIDDLPRTRQVEARRETADLLGFVRRAKRDGYVPHRCRHLGSLVFTSMDEWVDSLDDTPEDHQLELIERALERSIEAAYLGGIDYDDQIYCPTLFSGPWPRYPLVLIDEAQDLSPLNHLMLSRLVGQRLIAVGDPWQSIYGFRGAVAHGMRALRDQYSMVEFPLSVTFRVPRSGVERARSRVPHFQWADNAPEGRIEELAAWDADSVPNGAAIICRNNAPLFSAALRLLSQGRAIKLVGMDIGPGLVRILRKLNPSTDNEVGISAALDRWEAHEVRRARRPESVYEKAECLRVLTAGHDSLGSAVAHAEALFRKDGEIQLLSGHKAKGLEWETVFHLDSWRIPSRFAKPGTEEMEQELNVRYVIETRFKRELYLIDMEGFQ
jgi:DNA helicase-2/ATP-dependent DNA helicase PcrA